MPLAPSLAFPTLTIPSAASVNNAASRDRQIAAAGDRAVIPLTYGEDRSGALLLNILPAGATSPLLVVQCLWGWGLDSVNDVRLNDLELPAGSTQTHYTGGQTTPDATLVAAFAAQGINYTDTLNGYAYSVIAVPTRDFDGQLNFTARLRGRKVYDPRKDSTAGGTGAHRLNNPATWEWSDCPALHDADFLASTTYGAGETVDWASVAAAANANDVLVGSPAEKRRISGVTFTNQASCFDIAEALRAYAGCWHVPGANGVRLLPDADGAPVATYTHAAGQIAAIQPLQLADMGNSPTMVEVVYTDTSEIPWRDEVAVAQLAGAGVSIPLRVSTVRMPGIHRYSQAMREAVERLNKLRLGNVTTVVDLFDEGVRHEIGDIIALTHPVGLTGQPMRVQRVVMTSAGRWRLGVTSHDAGAYSDTVTTRATSVLPSNIITPGAPTQPSNPRAAPEPFGVRVAVDQNPEPDVQRYEYRLGATPETAVVLEENGGTSYLLAVQALGTYQFWIAAVDLTGLYSPWASATATVTAPSVTGVTTTVVGTNLNIAWGAAPGAFAIAGYEVRHGASFAAGTPMQSLQASSYTELVKWGGSRTYWVAAIDVKGNTGAAVPVVVTIEAPGAVSGQRADVVDNNALLYWDPPSTGSLPVERYEVRKGATWAGGTTVGSNGNSTFTAIFEQQAGTFTYWITAYDTANNPGTPAPVVATISQPPDYVLRSSIDSTFAGTKNNMVLTAGKLVGPVSTTETWATHFSSRGWNSPQDQVSAGFPLYAMPSLTSGYYEEVFDYGTTLPATTITATLNATVLAGSVTSSVTISWSTDNVSYTAGTAGQATVLAPAGFRYVRVRVDFSCTAGANLIEVNGLNVKLSSKQKTDSGRGTITTAASGVVVNFNVPFISADTPIVQPEGATPLIPVVDYTAVPNPTSFTVYLYNTSGVKVTGSFSWTARGT